MKRLRLGMVLFLTLPCLAQQISPRFEAAFVARERQWRETALPYIEHQQATHVDAEAQRYVSALGARLAFAAPQVNAAECRFILYDDNTGIETPGFGLVKDIHHVTVLPGGVVLVPVSLFSATSDEAEFSSALARGVAHVALKHWMRTVVGTSFVSWKPLSRTMLFTRSFEGEADAKAVEILARSGVNPEALLRIAGNIRASFDASAARLFAIGKAISELPQRVYAPAQSLQFTAIKTRLAEKPARV